MTNAEMFRKKVEERGVSYSFLADKMGISRASLYNKLDNKSEFKASEIAVATTVLRLSNKERDQIFFNRVLN